MRPPAPSHHHQRPSRPLRQNSWVTDEDPIQPAPPPNHNGAQQYNTLNGSAHLSSSTSPGTTPPASSLEVALVKQRLVNALGREGALLRLSAQLVPAVKLHIRRKRRALPSASAVTAKQIVSAIRRSDAPFFDNWSAADVTEIVKHASQRQYMFGETIVLPNEPAVSCGIVVVVSGDTMSSSPMLSSSTSGNGNNNSSSKRRSSAPHVLGVSAAVGEGFNSPTIVQAASPQVVVAVISFSAFRRAIWRHLARNESVKDAVRSMRLQTLCDQFYATPLGLGACSWLLSSLPDASLIKLSASGAIACSTLLTGSPISFENELMMVIRGQVRASTSDGGCMTLYPGSCLGEFSCIVPQYLGHVDELVEDRSITSLVVDAANGPCDVWTLSFRGLHAFLATECTEEARVQVLQTYIQARQEWLHRAVQHQQIQRNNSSDQQQQYQTVVSALRDVPCFAHCSDTLLGDLCANAVAKFVPRGSYVVLEGTPSNDLYVIVQGTVDEVAVDTSVVAPTTPQRATLSRRSVIGEYFLTPSSWNTSFIATSHVDVLVISSTSATATLEKHRALKQALDVSTQGVDLLRRRFSQVPVPSAPPNTVLGSLQNERIGSGDSLSATPPAGTRGRRPTSTKKSITSGIGSVSISPREVASQLWLAWSQDVQQQQLDENFLLHGSGSSMLLSPSSPNQLSGTVIAALGGRLQTLPTRERSSSQHDTAASAAGPVWSMVRTVSAPLNYYSETSLVRLLSTPARYKTSRMLLRRAPSQDDDHERDEASDSHREPHTPVPLPDESAIPYHHEDSVLSVASLRQTKNMQPLTEMEVLGVPSQLFGQQASVPFMLTMDESGSTDEWHFPNEMTTVVQNPNLRPRPPSPTQLPATPQRPHTTGGSSNNLTSESAFLRSTIVGTISPRPPRVASPGRPLTTGSIAAAASTGSNRATPTHADESAAKPPRSTSHDPPPRPPDFTSSMITASPPALQVAMLQLDSSQHADDMVHRALTPSSTLAHDNPQSNRRNDPRAKERTLSVTSVHNQRTLRPFSAQSRGQPSPMERMVHQRSLAAEEMNAAQPDSIWNTFLSFDGSNGGVGSSQPSLVVETWQDEQEQEAAQRPRKDAKGGAHVVAHPLLTRDDDNDDDPDALGMIGGGPPPKRSTTNVGQTPRPKPVVLLVHVLGCHNLEGCDSLIEPVVRVTGPGGKLFMTTPVMSNSVNPSWTIEQSSFITVLLRRDELRFTICDNSNGPDRDVVCFATMPTVDLESISGTGSRKLVWLSPSGKQLQSTLSLRVMVTCPDSQPNTKEGGLSASPHGLALGGIEDSRFSGSYSVVLGMCDVTLNHSTTNDEGRSSTPTPLTATLTVDDNVILTCSSEPMIPSTGRGRSATAVFPLETSSGTFSCEGGALRIAFSKDGETIGHALASVDEIAFSGLGVRTLNITAAQESGGPLGKLMMTPRHSAIGVVRMFVLQVSVPQGRLQQETQSSAQPLLLVSVRSFDGGENNNVPWQPDPFVSVFRGQEYPDPGARASTQLIRSSLVFSEARPEWSVRDASCVLPTQADDLFISICDNDEANQVADALVSVVPTTHGRLHLESRFNKLSGTGVVVVDVARVPLMRIGAAVKKVVPRNQDPNDQFVQEDTPAFGPPILLIHIPSCSGLRAEHQHNELAVDPIVTARFDHCTRHLMRSLTRFHSTDPTWSTVDGAAFAVDLSSCTASGMTPQLVFEVWSGSVGVPSDLIGSVTMSLRALASSGKQVHVASIRPASSSTITIETLLTYCGMAPFGVFPLRDTELLLNTLALLDEEDVSSPTTPKPLIRDDDFAAADSMLRSTNKSESFIRRVVPIKVSVLGCNNLPAREGHPFIVTQQGGNVLHTTPVALLGDMRNPVWKPNTASSLLHPLPIVPSTKRFVDEAPLTFVVMWQHGHDVVELARTSVSLASLLNSGGYIGSTPSPSMGSNDAVISPTILKTIELRFTPNVQPSRSTDGDMTRPLLRLMINHEEL